MPSRTSSSPSDVDLYRAAGARAFYGDPAFGEVKFLKPGAKPAMQKTDPELPWAAADWFAQEADGAAIGRLKLDGVADELAPIVTISNEGAFSVTGLSIADHFAWAGGRGADLEPLLAFCRKHGLAGPRTPDDVKKLVVKAKLNKLEAKVPKVDAKAWAKLVEGSRPSVPAAPAAAKPEKAPAAKAAKGAKGPAEGAAPVKPYSDYAYGCVGPDGAPWFVLSDGTKKGHVLARFGGKDLELVTKHPGGTEIACAGDTVVTLGLYDKEGHAYRDGALTTFENPLADGEMFELKGGGGAVYLIGQKQAYRWDGKAFAPIKLTLVDFAAYFVDGAGALLMVRSEVARWQDGKVTALAEAPFSVHKSVLAGGLLVVTGYDGSASTLALGGKAAWSKPFATSKNVDELIPLSDGRVLCTGKGHELHVLDPAKGTFAAAGKLLLTKGSAGRAAVATPDGGAVFVGGTLGLRSKNDPPLPPQRWRAGKTTAFPGLEKETAARAKEQ